MVVIVIAYVVKGEEILIHDLCTLVSNQYEIGPTTTTMTLRRDLVGFLIDRLERANGALDVVQSA